MNTLGESGVILKKLTLTDYATLIEDINVNFAQLLSSPLFKGTKGDSGDSGDPGDDGERGIKWLFCDLTKFQAQFPTLQSSAEITMSYINNKLLVAEDTQKLLDALETDRFVDKDIIVIPSGLVLSYSNSVNAFTPTLFSFASNGGVTQSQVQAMINAATSSINVSGKLYSLFTSLAKNYVDGGTGGQNSQINPDSILDIKTLSSGAGVDMLNDHKFIAMDEMLLPNETEVTQIIGSARKYHELVQRTQNGVGQTTNEYGPGVVDPVALAILQNNGSNGLIIGDRSADSLRDFGRLWKSPTGLVITSNYSAYPNEYGEIVISHTEIDLRAPVVNIKHALTVAETSQFVGAATFNDDVTLRASLNDVDILATDATSKVIRGMSIERTILQNVANSVPNSEVVWNEIFRLEQLIAALGGSTGSDLSGILNRLADLELRALRALGSAIDNNYDSQVTRGIRISNTTTTGAALPAGQNSFVTTYSHPSVPSQLFQLYMTKNTATTGPNTGDSGLYYRIGVDSGGWTFSSWVKIVSDAELNEVKTTIATLTATVNAQPTLVLAQILVDNNWITKSGTNPITLSHTEKTATSPWFIPTSYENRIPTNVVTDVTLDKNHVTSYNRFNLQAGLFPQAGFIIDFYYKPMMPITSSYAAIYNKFFLPSGRGRLVLPEANATVGTTPTIDLTHYVLCDGRNNTVDAGGIVFSGAGKVLSSVTTESGGTKSLGAPKTHSELDGSNNPIIRPGSYHGEHANVLVANQLPSHTHSYEDWVYPGSTNSLNVFGNDKKKSNGQLFGGFGPTNNDWDNDLVLYRTPVTGFTGNNESHETRQATMAVFKIMYVGPV